MGLIPETTCRRCGNRYSSLRPRCPMCGAPKANQSTRVPPTTASAMPNSPEAGRSASSIRWQVILGGVLVLAVIVAVIVLIITGSGKRGSSSPSHSGTSQTSPGTVYTAADLPSPSPSPDPTPEASPTPEIQSMAITFLNNTKTDISLTNAGELVIDLDLSIYPAVEGATVKWSSSNEKILKVDSNGIVTVVGASTTQWVHAVIIAECCGLSTYLPIYVPSYQATYLTENLFDAATYESDNAEWDAILYASPTPRA